MSPGSSASSSSRENRPGSGGGVERHCPSHVPGRTDQTGAEMKIWLDGTDKALTCRGGRRSVPIRNRSGLSMRCPIRFFFGEGKTDIFLGGPLRVSVIFLVWSGSSLSGADDAGWMQRRGKSSAVRSMFLLSKMNEVNGMGILDVIFVRGKHVCPWWLCRSFDNPLRRLFQDPERILRPHVKPGFTVIDVGPGMGYFTIPSCASSAAGGRSLPSTSRGGCWRLSGSGRIGRASVGIS